MPYVVFVANVGNRDIVLNIGDEASPFFLSFDKGEEGLGVKKFLNCSDEGTRALAKHVREHLSGLERRLRFPIVGSGVAKSLEVVGKIDQVLLLGSDQPESAGHHRLWDTIESARLLEVCLPAAFSDRIQAIHVEPAPINPSLHDEAFGFVGETLRRLVPPTKVDHVFASVKGGVPAMNAAVREHAVAMYGPKVSLIEVEEPSREDRLAGRAGQSRIAPSWPLRRETILRIAKTLLGRFDYEGLRVLLESEEVKDEEAIAVLRHAHLRLNLDFDEAAHSLKRFKTGRTHQWKVSAGTEWSRQRLLDLALSADVSLARQDFIGFLARAATFCENCRRQLVFVLTGLKVEACLFPSSVRDRKLLDALRARRKLATLKASGDREPPWRADRDLFNAIAHHWRESSTRGRDSVKKVQEVQRRLKQLEGLERLRNDVLHMMKGVSYSDLTEKLPEPNKAFFEIASTILAAMESIERMLGAPDHIVKGIYEDINEEVLDRLERYKPNLEANIKTMTPC
jgi:hypothetical protein